MLESVPINHLRLTLQQLVSLLPSLPPLYQLRVHLLCHLLIPLLLLFCHPTILDGLNMSISLLFSLLFHLLLMSFHRLSLLFPLFTLCVRHLTRGRSKCFLWHPPGFAYRSQRPKFPDVKPGTTIDSLAWLRGCYLQGRCLCTCVGVSRHCGMLAPEQQTKIPSGVQSD